MSEERYMEARIELDGSLEEMKEACEELGYDWKKEIENCLDNIGYR